MKKVILVLLILVLSGCSINKIENNDFEKTMDTILSKKVSIHNTVGKGYKYYAPRGVNVIHSDEYNDILEYNNHKYYLYVDIVRYYYKTKQEFTINPSAYISKELKYKDVNGYIEITENTDKKTKNAQYFIEMMYNYAKIEVYIDKKDLNIAINNISTILTSIKFNDLLLKKIYETGGYDSKEEVFNILEVKEKKGNFLDYINEYDDYDETTNKDETILSTTKQKEEVQ